MVTKFAGFGSIVRTAEEALVAKAQLTRPLKLMTALSSASEALKATAAMDIAPRKRRVRANVTFVICPHVVQYFRNRVAATCGCEATTIYRRPRIWSSKKC